MQFAKSKGICETAVDWWGQRILFPFFNEKGDLTYWQARSFDDSVPKYRNHRGPKQLYLLPPCSVDRRIIVEGVFDALKVHQATGLPVVAIGGKTVSNGCKKALLESTITRFELMLDGEALGATLALRDELAIHRTVVLHILPYGTDPADMSEEEIRDQLESCPDNL